MGTTVQKFKRALEKLEKNVAIINRSGFEEAISVLKSIQFELSEALARENMIMERFQHEMEMSDRKFFKFIFPILTEGDRRGADNYFAEFQEEEDE